MTKTPTHEQSKHEVEASVKMREDVSPTRHNPMTFLTITLILGVVVLTWLGWYSYSSYCEIKTTRERGLKIEKLRGTIIHLDEVLTMSARMAAATGDLRWEKRYRDFEPQLDDAIKESITFALETHSKEAATETDAANIKLVDMENGAFDLIRRGWTDEAKALLFSGEYERQKQIYAQGMTRFAQPQHRYVRLEELRSTISKWPFTRNNCHRIRISKRGLCKRDGWICRHAL